MRLRLLLAPLVASALLLSGCGVVNNLTGTSSTSTPSPTSNGVDALEADAIMSQATDALAGADSVRVVGTWGSGALSFVLDLTLAGDDVQGTVAVFGINASLIRVGKDYYVKADASGLAQILPADQQDNLPTLATKWLKVNLSLLEGLLPPLEPAQYVKPVAPLTKGAATTVGATPAITVTDANGTVYTVATVGKPYLMKVTSDNKSITFSEFGAAGPIQAPAAADTYQINL